MEKKGAVEVDWIVSLGIFLVFLSLFFIYLAPYSIRQPDVSENLLSGVEDAIRENATWQAARIPVLINSNTSSTEPIILQFPLSWNNLSFSDNTSFFRQEGKLLFASSLRQGMNLKWVVTSDDAYPQPEITADLAPTQNSVFIDSARFGAEFDGLPVSASHFDKARISSLNLSIDGVVIIPESKESNSTNFAAKYKMQAEQLNHTTFVVAGFPRLMNFITTDKLEPHNVTVKMTLHNYTHFYINSELSGTINFTQKECTNSFTGIADFYDATSGLSIVSYEKASMGFCTGNTTVEFSISIPVSGEKRYDLVFHLGDYSETGNYTSLYTSTLGMAENISGLSMRRLTDISNTSYSSLKDAWGFPSQRDFSFQLVNESNHFLINYSPRNPGLVNTYAREFDEVLLDKYGIKTKRTLRIRGW